MIERFHLTNNEGKEGFLPQTNSEEVSKLTPSVNTTTSFIKTQQIHSILSNLELRVST